MSDSSGIRIVDYLSFTVKDCTSPERIIEKLGLKFLTLGYGRFGYKAAAIAESGGVNVYWDGFKDEMGVHVQISGKGCRLVEAMPGFTSWQEYIGGWFDDGAKVKRIDLAIDDESATVEFETVKEAVVNRTAVCRADYCELRESRNKRGIFQTLYVGRRTSETMMRCYDKGMQLGEGRSWLRFEFEYKGERADAVARVLAYKGWDAAIGVARSFIEFKDETHKTTDRTRQRAATWWVNLINASKHVLRITKQVNANVAKMFGWLMKQVSPSIATLMEIEGGSIEWILDLVKEGQQKLKDKHRLMIRSATGPSLLGAST